MALFKHRSIRRDLVVIIMIIAVFSILLTTVSMSVIGYVNFRKNIEEELQRAASIVGDRNAALLQYANIPNIRRKAFINLNVFSDDDSIELTCLYNQQGELVAFYDKAAIKISDLASSSDIGDDEFTLRIEKNLTTYLDLCPATNEKGYTRFSGESVEVMQPIMLQRKLKSLFGNSDKAGYLYIRSSLAQIDNYVRGQMITAIMITLAILSICYLLTLKLQNSISLPIRKLSEATRKVSLYRDYSVRVEAKQGGYSEEIEQLIASFNGMLTEIEERDSKLIRKNVELERAKEVAESASIAKSQFLANISH